MGKILEALADDNLCINPTIYKGSRDYQKAVKIMYETAESLEEKLNEEEKKLFEQFRNAESDEGLLYASDRFVKGYQLGVLMTMEVFAGHNTFIIGKEACDNG